MLFATPLFLFVLLAITAAVLGNGRRGKPAEQTAAAEISPVESSPAESPAVDPAEKSDAERFVGRGVLGLLYELVPWRLYFSYYRPSFHPWDHDNSGFGLDAASAGLE